MITPGEYVKRYQNKVVLPSDHDLFDIDFSLIANHFKSVKTSDKVGTITSPFNKHGLFKLKSVDWKINQWMKPGPLNQSAIESQFELVYMFMSTVYSHVHIMDYPMATESLHDIIFSANHFSSIRELNWNQETVQSLLFIANMANKERQGEQPFVIDFVRSIGAAPIQLPASIKFEGNGDCVHTPFMIIGFTGDRTDPEAYASIQQSFADRQLIGKPILVIESVSGTPFYHGDLKLKPLHRIDNKTKKMIALYVPSAFTAESMVMLDHIFKLIPIDETEALNLGINTICGYSSRFDVDMALVPEGAPQLAEQLMALNYKVFKMPVATQNLGGGPWCMINELQH